MTAVALARSAPTALPRTFAAITLELVTIRARLASHYARQRDPTDAEDEDWSQLEDRRFALEKELAAEFRRLSGVDLTVVVEVMS